MEERITDLFIKEKAGEISEAEHFELQQYLASPEYKVFYNSLDSQWELSGRLRLDIQSDTQQSWDRLSPKLKEKQRSILVPQMVWRMAAILVIGFAVGYYFFTKPAIIKVSTGIAEHREVLLPDGSRVMMNESSELSYSEAFAEEETRSLEFSGEAFFDVERNEEKPFLIAMDIGMVKVLGTAFNIDAYPSEKLLGVSVSEGTVALINNASDQQVILKKGMYGSLDRHTGTLASASPELNNSDFWRTGVLTYENAKLEDVVNDLNKQFAETLGISSESLGECRFTSTFENPSLEEVVEIIAASMNLTYEKTSSGYVLSGAGCNQF